MTVLPRAWIRKFVWLAPLPAATFLSSCATPEKFVIAETDRSRVCLERRSQFVQMADPASDPLRERVLAMRLGEFGMYGRMVAALGCEKAESDSSDQDLRGILIAYHEAVHLVGFTSHSSDERAAFYLLEADRVVQTEKYKSAVPPLRDLTQELADLKTLFAYRAYVQDAKDDTILTLFDEWNASSLEGLLAIKLNRPGHVLHCQHGPNATILDSSREMRILVARAISILRVRYPVIYQKLRADSAIQELLVLLEERTRKITLDLPKNPCLAGVTPEAVIQKQESVTSAILKNFATPPGRR